MFAAGLDAARQFAGNLRQRIAERGTGEGERSADTGWQVGAGIEGIVERGREGALVPG